MTCFNFSLFFNYIKNWFRNRGNLKKNSKDIFTVKYKYNGKKYLIPIIVKRGPKPVIQKVVDENGNDITKEFSKYYGPYANFNGISLTPKLLGYKYLVISYNDETKNFNTNDVISL